MRRCVALGSWVLDHGFGEDTSVDVTAIHEGVEQLRDKERPEVRALQVLAGALGPRATSRRSPFPASVGGHVVPLLGAWLFGGGDNTLVVARVLFPAAGGSHKQVQATSLAVSQAFFAR